jgi:EAL domain-containing protein (putative c-di-GMP-specific phosphodiesterase class I)
MTQALAMQPGRILVEIPESMIGDVDSLVKFVSVYRAKGFLLALDDIGSGLSNLDRISLIKPDILKLDRSLIRSTTFEYHSREIVRSMVNLSHRIGSLVIAGGIETVEEALLSVELGVDMLQGFYFAEPGVREAQDIPDVTEKVNRIADDFRKNTIQKINARKMQHRKYNHIINDFTCELTKADEESFDTILENLIRANHELECAYILDDRGIQVSSTVFAPDKGGPGQGFFFQPGHHGTDQSSKDYFFLLNAGLPKFTTQPYISLASRNVCITISVAFRDINYKKRILCLDITQDDMSGLRNAAP